MIINIGNNKIAARLNRCRMETETSNKRNKNFLKKQYPNSKKVVNLKLPDNKYPILGWSAKARFKLD